MSEKAEYLDKRQVVMMVVLLMGAALSVLNQTSVSPMLAIIMNELNVSSPTVQWLVSGFSLVTAVVIPVTAYLMKRFPTRNVFFASMVFFLVGCVLCFVAPVFPVLMAGRVCQAICAGMLMPLATNIMLLIFPPEKRGFAMGIYSLITSLMPAIGPAAAGGLTDCVGWRMVYVIMLALAAIITIFAVFSLKNYGEAERIALDVPSVILSALGLVALLSGISSIGNGGFTPVTALLIGGGVVVIALFVWRQTRLDQPVLNMEVFKYRRFVIGLCTVMVVMLISTAPGVTLPLIVQEGLGASASVTGLMMVPASVLGAVSALTAGRLFDRFGCRPLAIAGSCILTMAYVGCALMDASIGVLWLACCMILSNVGLMCVTTPLNTWSLGFLPDRLIPHGNAMSNTLRQVSMSISISLFVTVMAVATNSAADPASSAAVVAGGRLTFICEAVLCVVVLIVIIAFVRPGAEAEYAAAQPKEPAEACARDFMRINAPFLSDTATIREAMTLFSKEGITDSPIVDAKGQVVAFLSSSDIMSQLVDKKVITPELSGWTTIGDGETLSGRLSEIIDRNVMGIATRNVITVAADDSFEHVCSILAKRRIKKVPVVDDGRLAGTVNRDDIVHHVMRILAADSAPAS